MKNNLKKTFIFFSAIFFIASFLAFFLFYKQIKNNENTAEVARENWQTESSRREDIKSLDQSVKMIEPEMAILNSHFALSSDVVPFLNNIEMLGQKTGSKIKVSSVDISKDNTSLIVETKASGTFTQIYKFLTLLENSPYELEFNSVDLHNLVSEEELKNHSKNPNWEMILKIKLLSFIP